jgi:hypothetical protein
MDRKGFTLIVVIVIIGIVLIAAAIGYFVWKNSATQQQSQAGYNSPSISASSSLDSNPSPASVIATSTVTSPVFASSSEGTVINDQYGGLFILTAQGDQDCGTPPNSYLSGIGSGGLRYIDGGMVTSGKYDGYHIVIAGIPNCGPPGGDSPDIFITKDYQTFIVDDTSSDYNADPSTADMVYNKAKVVGFDPDISINSPPQIIQLGNFVLIQNDLYVGTLPTSSSMLTSLVSGLDFYSNAGQDYDYPYYFTGPEGPDIAYGDDVLVKEPGGPLFTYLLVSKEEFSRADNSSSSLDGNFYEINNISSSMPLYKTYGEFSPTSCGGSFTTDVLQNISQSDLSQVGETLSGVSLYTLANPDSQLNNDEFTTKITNQIYPATATYMDDGTPVPSFNQYVSKNPVLVFQDPWGRWIALGEYDYELPSGCGKPVIYLYPPKPTEVSVKFMTPMRLTTDIPTYANDGWHVLAQPDGELTDLQPQFTDCAAIDSTAPGSEYAYSACEHNDYPYLYWEGQASGQYPTPTGGWVVPQANIANFLDQKLTQIGLTSKEKSDMMSYWVSELLQKNSPYYRISFFQTAQMDQFIPMDVSPKPDTTLRVFLDWSPLASMPSVLPQPETLYHVDRQGFTLVEWGGLKQ